MYTRGPWEIEYDNGDHGGEWYIVGPAQIHFGATGDEVTAKANAKLISAAPDLLEALKKCNGLIGEVKTILYEFGLESDVPLETLTSMSENFENALSQIQAAIAKAEGI